MKLTKKKISKLLKIKNQSVKKTDNKKNRKTKDINKTFRKKKGFNLLNKTFKNFLYSGGVNNHYLKHLVGGTGDENEKSIELTDMGKTIPKFRADHFIDGDNINQTSSDIDDSPITQRVDTNDMPIQQSIIPPDDTNVSTSTIPPIDTEEPTPPITEEEQNEVPPITEEPTPPITEEEQNKVPSITEEPTPPITDEEQNEVPPITEEEQNEVPSITEEEQNEVPPITEETTPPITDEEQNEVPPITEEEQNEVPSITEETTDDDDDDDNDENDEIENNTNMSEIEKSFDTIIDYLSEKIANKININYIQHNENGIQNGFRAVQKATEALTGGKTRKRHH